MRILVWPPLRAPVMLGGRTRCASYFPSSRVFLSLLAASAWAAHNRVEVHLKAPFAIEDIAEGPDGILYLAGSTGLHRYDGFRYTVVPGYPFGQAAQVAVTQAGDLLATSREGIVRRGPDGSFETVHAEPGARFAVAGSYVFVVSREHHRLLRWTPDWSTKEIPIPPECRSPYWRQEFGLQLVCRTNSAWFELDPVSLNLRAMPGPPPRLGPIADGMGRQWIVDSARSVLSGSHLEAAQVPLGNGATPLLRGRRGQVWLTDGETIRGLAPPVRFPVSIRTSPVAVLEDQRGHVWAGTRDGDLWELIPDPTWEQWSAEALGGAAPVQVFRNSAGELIGVTEARLFRFDEEQRQWHPMSPESRRYEYVLPLPSGELLASVRDFGVARLTAGGQLRERLGGSDAPHLRDDFRKLIRTPEGRVLLGNRHALLEWSGQAAPAFLELPGVRNAAIRPSDGFPLAHALDFEVDSRGTVWVGYDAGLAWRDAQMIWQRMKTDERLSYVRSFQFRGPGEIWVAHRNDGAFSVVRGGKVTRMRADDGYTPAATHFLKVDRRGWIWRGTSRGVYVSNGRDIAPEAWLFLDASGKSRPYGFFEDTDGSVWIAGRAGITHVRPQPTWFEDTPGSPLVSRVVVDGQERAALPDKLEALPRRVEVEFARLGTAAFRQEPIRYRLLPRFSDWRVARRGRVELNDLEAGSYQLEVRQQGTSGVLRHSIRLGPAITPLWWWLFGPLSAAAGWGIWRRERLVYRYRKAWYMLRRWRAGNFVGSEPHDLAGRVLRGRYQLERRVAAGGFSSVYAATDRLAGARVAVKILDQRISDAVWVRARFAQELAALQLVRHPGVIEILDSWIAPSGEPCLAMPLIEGRPLRESLNGAPWDGVRAGRLVRALGDALGAVHEAGVVHRDLKPENIVLTASGDPILIDFGTSGLLGPAEDSGMTTMLAGSLEYLAPERLTGHYSPASDLYSLAAIVFELLTGTKLAHSKLVVSGDLSEALAERLATQWGRPVAALLADGLQPLPERRPATVRVWAAELAGALGTSPASPAQSRSRLPRATPAASDESPLR